MLREVVQLFATNALSALMLGAALRCEPGLLRRLRERPWMFLRALVVLWLGVPLLAILTVTAFALPPMGAATLLVVSICPGVPLLVRSTRKVHGGMSTAVLLLLLSAITAPLLVPLWVRILSAIFPVAFAIQPAQVVRALLPIVLVPIAAGVMIRWLLPRVAPILARVADVVFAVGIVILLVAVLILGVPRLPEVGWRNYVAVLVVTFGAGLMGYWAGRPALEDRKATALAAAMGNPALALAVVAASYPGYPATVLIALYVLIRALALIPFKRWLGARGGPARHGAEPAHA
jgi:BASS family bile acid:Na+ symporter